MFGDFFCEYKILTAALEIEMDYVKPDIRKKLYYIFSYEGQNTIKEADFLKIMTLWSAFTANDINRDNILDIYELEMLIWLLKGKKPTPAQL